MSLPARCANFHLAFHCRDYPSQGVSPVYYKMSKLYKSYNKLVVFIIKTITSEYKPQKHFSKFHKPAPL